MVASRRLIGTLRGLRAGCLVRPGPIRPLPIRPLPTGTAIRLCRTVGTTRRRIAAVITARPRVAPRVPRTVPPDIAISVAVSAIAISIPVAPAAAAASISIVTGLAMRRPLALSLG